jgi:hypothetical protein
MTPVVAARINPILWAGALTTMQKRVNIIITLLVFLSRRRAFWLAVPDRVTAISWPRHEFFEEIIAVLDAGETRFKWLEKNPNAWAQSRYGPGDKDQKDEP